VIEDLILLRTDGSPTYNLSVVSDDVAMRITHVIRGDDHISNTPKQILIYEGLGTPPPVFAHLPPDLRPGQEAAFEAARRDLGARLPHVGLSSGRPFNFLALLGWNPGDERQKMSRDELIAAFDLDGVGKSGAIFDAAKLEWLNGLYVAELPMEVFAEPRATRSRRLACGTTNTSPPNERGSTRFWPAPAADEDAPALPVEGRFFFDPSDALDYDAAGVKKHLRGDATWARFVRSPCAGPSFRTGPRARSRPSCATSRRRTDWPAAR
jgi:glutamyl-tRNA synthetase